MPRFHPLYNLTNQGPLLFIVNDTNFAVNNFHSYRREGHPSVHQFHLKFLCSAQFGSDPIGKFEPIQCTKHHVVFFHVFFMFFFQRIHQIQKVFSFKCFLLVSCHFMSNIELFFKELTSGSIYTLIYEVKPN